MKSYYVNFEYVKDEVFANSEEEAIEIFRKMLKDNEIRCSITSYEND